MRDKLEPNVMRDMVIFGLKLDGNTCAKRNVVDQAVPFEQLMPTCLSLARTLAPTSSHRQVFSQIKSVVYHEAIKAANQEFIVQGTAMKLPKF
jgi:hypothetical protein